MSANKGVYINDIPIDLLLKYYNSDNISETQNEMVTIEMESSSSYDVTLKFDKTTINFKSPHKMFSTMDIVKIIRDYGYNMPITTLEVTDGMAEDNNVKFNITNGDMNLFINNERVEIYLDVLRQYTFTTDSNTTIYFLSIYTDEFGDVSNIKYSYLSYTLEISDSEELDESVVLYSTLHNIPTFYNALFDGSVYDQFAMVETDSDTISKITLSDNSTIDVSTSTNTKIDKYINNTVYEIVGLHNSQVITGYVVLYNKSDIPDVDASGRIKYRDKHGNTTTKSSNQSSFALHQNEMKRLFQSVNNYRDPVFAMEPGIIGIVYNGLDYNFKYYNSYIKNSYITKTTIDDIELFSLNPLNNKSLIDAASEELFQIDKEEYKNNNLTLDYPISYRNTGIEGKILKIYKTDNIIDNIYKLNNTPDGMNICYIHNDIITSDSIKAVKQYNLLTGITLSDLNRIKLGLFKNKLLYILPILVAKHNINCYIFNSNTEPFILVEKSLIWDLGREVKVNGSKNTYFITPYEDSASLKFKQGQKYIKHINLQYISGADIEHDLNVNLYDSILGISFTGDKYSIIKIKSDETYIKIPLTITEEEVDSNPFDIYYLKPINGYGTAYAQIGSINEYFEKNKIDRDLEEIAHYFNFTDYTIEDDELVVTKNYRNPFNISDGYVYQTIDKYSFSNKSDKRSPFDVVNSVFKNDKGFSYLSFSDIDGSTTHINNKRFLVHDTWSESRGAIAPSGIYKRNIETAFREILSGIINNTNTKDSFINLDTLFIGDSSINKMRAYCAGFADLVRNDSSQVKTPVVTYRQFSDTSSLKYRLVLEKRENVKEPVNKSDNLENNPMLYTLLTPMQRIFNYKQFPYNDLYQTLGNTLDSKKLLESANFELETLSNFQKIDKDNKIYIGKEKIVPKELDSLADIKNKSINLYSRHIISSVKKSIIKANTTDVLGKTVHSKFITDKISSDINQLGIPLRISDNDIIKPKKVLTCYDNIEKQLKELNNDPSFRWVVI